MKTKVNQEDQFEHVDDILKQMNKRLDPKTEEKEEKSGELAPRVVA